jgi:hypothetical protein
VLGNPKALGTQSRQYLQDFYRQGQGKLQAADAQAQNKAQAQAQARSQAAEAGNAVVNKLGDSIARFDRSGRSATARTELNQAVAGARAADKSGWSAATKAQYQTWNRQASQRLWSAPAKPVALKPSASSVKTAKPSLEFFGAPQGTAVYDASTGLEIGRVLVSRSGLGWQIQFDNGGHGAPKIVKLDFDAQWMNKQGADFPKTRQDVARWVFKAFGNQSQFTRSTGTNAAFLIRSNRETVWPAWTTWPGLSRARSNSPQARSAEGSAAPPDRSRQPRRKRRTFRSRARRTWTAWLTPVPSARPCATFTRAASLVNSCASR